MDLHTGLAADSLHALVAAGAGPFDLIFIDADKPSNPEYLEWSLKLARVGTLIVGDNIARAGAVIDTQGQDRSVVGTRRFLELIGASPRLAATAIQTVGSKGYDGFVLAIVQS